MPKGAPKIDWNEENLATLRRMWDERYSSSQIASQIKNATRNAVMGKLNRLGLSGQKPKSKKSGAPKPPRARAAGAPRSRKRKEPAPKAKIPDAPDMRRLTYAENDGCMWELEERGVYCGAPNAKGYHFCQYHNHIARPPREKKTGHPGRE